MSEIFDKKRFGKYFISDIKDFWSSNRIILSIILLVGILSYIPFSLLTYISNNVWAGSSSGMRVACFIICMLIMMALIPSKSYGKANSRKLGINWILTPASTLEKTLSMVIITIGGLLLTAGIYLSLDALLCVIDKTCGESIISTFCNSGSTIDFLFGGDMGPAEQAFYKTIFNPLLYLDDYIGGILIFLLGAVYFKSAKPAKTILTIFIFIVAISILAAIISNMIPSSNEFYLSLEDELEAKFSRAIFRHVALIDTINDTIVNCALIAAIYFKTKNIKL